MIRKIAFLTVAFTLMAFSGCIGVDYIDDTGFMPSQDKSYIQVDADHLALFLGDQEQIVATYYDDDEVVQQVDFTYSSGNTSIATVDATGKVTAQASGQTTIEVSYEQLSAEVLVTVVSDSSSIASIELVVNKLSLDVGQTLQFMAKALTIGGVDISSQVQFEWFSSDMEIATVDANGLLTALNNGEVKVWAQVNDTRSSYCIVRIGGNNRMGTFSGLSGYNVSGTVFVTRKNSTEIEVSFAADFKSQSGPGLFLYLTNQKGSTNGAFEIGELKSTNGEQTYIVEAGLYDYNYVQVHCKPFNVPFGIAALQ